MTTDSSVNGNPQTRMQSNKYSSQPKYPSMQSTPYVFSTSVSIQDDPVAGDELDGFGTFVGDLNRVEKKPSVQVHVLAALTQETFFVSSLRKDLLIDRL